jgi:outer-membrane receptor for ferric coprogen and ferric-rhodotorulic acid
MSRTAPRGYELEVQFDGVPSAIRFSAIAMPSRSTNAPPFACNGADCYRATGLVISEGIDVGVAGACPRNWNIFGGYTYLHQTYANGELKGERFRPADARKSVQDGDALHCSEDDRQQCAVPRRYFCGRSELVHPGHSMAHRAGRSLAFGLMTKFQATEQAYILLTVENLFDETYYSGIGVPYHGQVYGDPRKATLTLRKSF